MIRHTLEQMKIRFASPVVDKRAVTFRCCKKGSGYAIKKNTTVKHYVNFLGRLENISHHRYAEQAVFSPQNCLFSGKTTGFID